jgi:hypothetical protein
MSQDSERMKRLVDFKQKLEKKVEDLESELMEQRAVLETVNQLLLEKGFKRPAMPEQEPIHGVSQAEEGEGFEPEGKVKTKVNEEAENVVDLRAADGELLARLYSDDRNMHVIPAEDKNFDVNTSPFGNFLVERVLMKMQERDAELARMRKLSPASIFSYNIRRDGDLIKEILVKNIDAERLKELSSSIRWTFEKMYEKMKSGN